MKFLYESQNQATIRVSRETLKKQQEKAGVVFHVKQIKQAKTNCMPRKMKINVIRGKGVLAQNVLSLSYNAIFSECFT